MTSVAVQMYFSTQNFIWIKGMAQFSNKDNISVSLYDRMAICNLGISHICHPQIFGYPLSTMYYSMVHTHHHKFKLSESLSDLVYEISS